MKISIIGLGYLGTPLALRLKADHEVLGTSRDPEKKVEAIQVFQLTINTRPSAELLNSDVIVLNIPPFPEQLKWFQSWAWNKNTWVIFVSSTSVYEEAAGTVNEESKLKDNDLVQEENWIKENFAEWTILRMGGLIGNGRHPTKTLLQKKSLKNKNWPVNLIHVDDAVCAIEAVIDKNVKNEIINVVSDEHSTREVFYFGCDFDPTDESTGRIVDNSKFKKFYSLKWPTMLGKSL